MFIEPSFSIVSVITMTLYKLFVFPFFFLYAKHYEEKQNINILISSSQIKIQCDQRHG